jgi:hypothetical protein
MTSSDRDLLLVHAAFGAIAAAALAVPLPIATGWRVFALVAVYLVAMPVVARARGHATWWSLILFLWPMSVFMLLPDWFLSAVLGTLRFPDDGAPRLDTINLAMAGMWTVPLFLSTYAGHRAAQAVGSWAGPLVAGLVGVAILGGAELAAPTLGLWSPHGVREWSGVALYVVVPEWILAVTTYQTWQRTRSTSWLHRAHWGLLLALTYLGALCVSYLLIDGGG